MKVQRHEISDDALAAGREAMRGQFRAHDVVMALCRAGVTPLGYIADRAADRLLQNERKAGRIRAVHNKLWEVVPQR